MKLRKAPLSPRPPGLESAWLSGLLPEDFRPEPEPEVLTPDGRVILRSECPPCVGVILRLDHTPASACLLWQALTAAPALGGLPQGLRWGVILPEPLEEEHFPASSWDTMADVFLSAGRHVAGARNWVPMPQRRGGAINWPLILGAWWKAKDPLSLEVWSPTLTGSLTEEAVPFGDLGRVRRPLQEQGILTQEAASRRLAPMAALLGAALASASEG